MGVGFKKKAMQQRVQTSVRRGIQYRDIQKLELTVNLWFEKNVRIRRWSEWLMGRISHLATQKLDRSVRQITRQAVQNYQVVNLLRYVGCFAESFPGQNLGQTRQISESGMFGSGSSMARIMAAVVRQHDQFYLAADLPYWQILSMTGKIIEPFSDFLANISGTLERYLTLNKWK